MSTTMTLVDGATTIPLSVGGAPSPNAVVVKNYDLGYPTAREVISDLAGQSGVLDMTSLHGQRIVKLDVYILDVPGVTRHQTLDLLRVACHPSHRPQLFVQCAGWPQQRVMAMRGQPVSCVIGPSHAAFLEATLSWVVPGGCLLSAATNTATIYLPLSASVGLALPITLPASWASGNTVNVASVVCAGNEPSSPVWKFYGGVTQFALTNQTTGQTLAINNTIPDGHCVVVDIAARTALLDGDPNQSLYGSIDFTVSSWWTLQPGTNNIAATAQSSDLGAQVFFSWSDQWI